MKLLLPLFAIISFYSYAIAGYTWQDLRIITDNHEPVGDSIDNTLLVAGQLQAKRAGWLQELPADITLELLIQLCGESAHNTHVAIKRTEQAGYVYPEQAKQELLAVITACSKAYKTGDVDDCLCTIYTTRAVAQRAMLSLTHKERAALVGIILEDALSDMQQGKLDTTLAHYAQEILDNKLPLFGLDRDPEYAAQIGVSVKQQLQACIAAADQSSCTENFQAVIALLKQFNEAQ